MNRSACELLEDHLAGELTPQTQRAFDLHLDECESCRSQVAAQESIDAWLIAANKKVELPATLQSRVVQGIQLAAKRRMRSSFAAGVTAAAATALLLGAIVRHVRHLNVPRQSDSPHIAETPRTSKTVQADSTKESTNKQTGREEGTIPRDRHVTITFPDNQHIVAVDVPSTDPTITIMMVYPAHKPRFGGKLREATE